VRDPGDVVVVVSYEKIVSLNYKQKVRCCVSFGRSSASLLAPMRPAETNAQVARHNAEMYAALVYGLAGKALDLDDVLNSAGKGSVGFLDSHTCHAGAFRLIGGWTGWLVR
jgi:hypothetical protein